MSSRRNLPRPVMARPTSLDPDQTPWQAREKGQDLSFAQAPIKDNLTLFGDAVNLKDVLGQIKADRGNLHGVAPLSQMTTPAL